MSVSWDVSFPTLLASSTCGLRGQHSLSELLQTKESVGSMDMGKHWQGTCISILDEVRIVKCSLANLAKEENFQGEIERPDLGYKAGAGNLFPARGHAGIYNVTLGPHRMVHLKISLLYWVTHFTNSPLMPWQGHAGPPGQTSPPR